MLDVQHGEVYAYDLTLRAFSNLRADGTFIYSSGAADNRIASLKPEEDSSTYQILAESRTDSAGGISYTVDGLAVTGTEYSRVRPAGPEAGGCMVRMERDESEFAVWFRDGTE